ncbi:MAG: DUF3168 domain-containing protein [Brevundimonas sp.]
MIVIIVRDLLLEHIEIEADVGDRIYPVEWPDAPEFPLIIIQKATGLGETDTQGEAGIEQTRVQVDVYANGYAEAVRISKKVRMILHGFKGGPEAYPCAIDRSACINDADLPVPATERAGPRLRRRMSEFMIWNREV